MNGLALRGAFPISPCESLPMRAASFAKSAAAQPAVDLVPVDFAQLDGFNADDHLAAFAVFARTAAAICGELPSLRPARAPRLRRCAARRLPILHVTAKPRGFSSSGIFTRFASCSAAARQPQPASSPAISTVRLVYAGRNGQPYSSIGRMLVEMGEVSGADMGLARVKQWVYAHGLAPAEAGAALLARNKSYIFFALDSGGAETEGPIGGAGVRLTPLRSIAIDRSLWSYGLPFWVCADLPWQGPEASPFRRLMIAQDTGSAIIGPARADIFFGSGEEAGRCAGEIGHACDSVVLLPRGGGEGQ
jgi:3D (Asp-Asp-Asp) domain-containing protein